MIASFFCVAAVRTIIPADIFICLNNSYLFWFVVINVYI